MRTARVAVALVVAMWLGQWTFEQLMGDSAWRLVGAVLAGGSLAALGFTAVNDGPRALVEAVVRGRSARR